MQNSLIPKYDLRWKLQYRDGTKEKIGYWTRPGIAISEMASFQKTDGLARAFVEVKDKETGIIRTPIHCAGHDFCLFKWVQLAKLGIGKVSGDVVGLTLVTREVEATFYIDGRLKTDLRKKEDKEFHYEGYGQ